MLHEATEPIIIHIRQRQYQSAASRLQHPNPNPTPTSGSILDPPHYSSMYITQSDAYSLRYSAERGIASTNTSHLSSWPPGVNVPPAVDPLVSSTKRSSEVLYHPTALSPYDRIGQTEAWYSAISLAKRPRFEMPSSLPIYPQRHGEKDCTHYMLTRTCKFGDTCKFDHPIWVPEGGMPDWKEVPLIGTSDFLPERPGEPDCPYFLKTQRCKYGFRCKFNHPKEGAASGALENSGASALPDRPSEPPCAFYLKTGKCKFGATCKFHHPKDIQLPLLGQEDGDGTSVVTHDETIGDVGAVNTLLVTPAPFHNSKGLPMRMGEVDCPFYLKTGSCKYGATCRYNHPERNEIINPPVAALSHTIVAPSVANLNIGVFNPASSLNQTVDPRLAQSMLQLGVRPTIYPQRPGQAECDYYMKTGECKFGERCKYHHPPQAVVQAHKVNVKLTLAGLPRREGSVHCPYYMKTGTCKYGASCKFDHPPPGEAMAQGSPSDAEEQGAY